jgi:hypothetical protein
MLHGEYVYISSSLFDSANEIFLKKWILRVTQSYCSRHYTTDTGDHGIIPFSLNQPVQW